MLHNRLLTRTNFIKIYSLKIQDLSFFWVFTSSPQKLVSNIPTTSHKSRRKSFRNIETSIELKITLFLVHWKQVNNWKFCARWYPSQPQSSASIFKIKISHFCHQNFSKFLRLYILFPWKFLDISAVCSNFVGFNNF